MKKFNFLKIILFFIFGVLSCALGFGQSQNWAIEIGYGGSANFNHFSRKIEQQKSPLIHNFPIFYTSPCFYLYKRIKEQQRIFLGMQYLPTGVHIKEKSAFPDRKWWDASPQFYVFYPLFHFQAGYEKSFKRKKHLELTYRIGGSFYKHRTSLSSTMPYAFEKRAIYNTEKNTIYSFEGLPVSYTNHSSYGVGAVLGVRLNYFLTPRLKVGLSLDALKGLNRLESNQFVVHTFEKKVYTQWLTGSGDYLATRLSLCKFF